MKNARIISRIFAISALVLSVAMCALVVYQYINLAWAGSQFLTSAPPWVAFFLAIPFILPIGVCVILYFVFKKQAEKYESISQTADN